MALSGRGVMVAMDVVAMTGLVVVATDEIATHEIATDEIATDGEATGAAAIAMHEVTGAGRRAIDADAARSASSRLHCSE